MSFFNKMLASIGIGSAKVDTRLSDNELHAGEEVSGVVYITGGNLEQQVDTIYLHLMTQYIRERDDHKFHENCIIRKVQVSAPFRLAPGEKKEIPFSFPLPFETPVTAGSTKVWLRTGLDIENAVDPSDDDYIKVLPHPYLNTVLEAVRQLGFSMKRSECEYSPRYGSGMPFIQEFEFYPGGAYYGRLDELELVPFVRSSGIEMILEVDRRARGLAGLFESAMDLDERKVRLSFSDSELRQGPAYIAGRLNEVISYHAR